MTEDQYQQLRQFIKLNGRYLVKISPEQLKNLKEVSNQAKNVRNRVFYHKQKVIDATRMDEKYNTEMSRKILMERMTELQNAKWTFACFFFDTSSTKYDTIKSDKQKNQNQDYENLHRFELEE